MTAGESRVDSKANNHTYHLTSEDSSCWTGFILPFFGERTSVVENVLPVLINVKTQQLLFK